MNHNLKPCRACTKRHAPGADYQFRSACCKNKALMPGVPTKSGLMVGLGETDEEILQVMRDMRAHGIKCSPLAST